tara:strand:- start:2254 stop:2700 length:447 start_codon:yes stop_codon:yes gene_type:complete
MAHVRKLIRDNITTTVTGLTTTASRVYQSRIYPLETGELNGLCVYTLREASEPVSVGGSSRTIQREVEIVIEAYVRGTSGYDNTIDTICVEVEEALAADLSRGGNAEDTSLASTEIEFSGDGDQPIAMCRLTYAVIYLTAQNDVETDK